SQGLIGNDYIVLEIEVKEKSEYISFSEIIKVYFSKQENLDLFLERSYENYDVRLFDSKVFIVKENIDDIKIDIIHPEQVDKKCFTQTMALRDSIIRLIYDEIKNSNSLISFIEKINNSKTLDSI